MQSTTFQNLVKTWYSQNGRHTLPWRIDLRPYSIFVSELMLQQTQVDRVKPKFEQFIQQFPTAQILAQAQLGEVLRSWQGLGYNRRAKYLWQTAQLVVAQGDFPHSIDDLEQLPGIGPYTSRAIAAFAFNQPVVMIETNIRAVFLHHYFPTEFGIKDTEILPLIKATLDITAPRIWYWALMDYGSYLKSQVPNPSRRSKHHVRQAAFIGSKRQLRGAIIQDLTQQNTVSHHEFQKKYQQNDFFSDVIQDLVKESMIQENNGNYSI